MGRWRQLIGYFQVKTVHLHLHLEMIDLRFGVGLCCVILNVSRSSPLPRAEGLRPVSTRARAWLMSGLGYSRNLEFACSASWLLATACGMWHIGMWMWLADWSLSLRSLSVLLLVARFGFGCCCSWFISAGSCTVQVPAAGSMQHATHRGTVLFFAP